MHVIPRWPLAGMIAAILMVSGCGTAANTLWFTPFEGGMRPYGGVRADAVQVKQYCEDKGTSPGTTSAGQAALFAADIPLSLVADTLTLPITIPAWLIIKANGYDRLPVTPSEPSAPQ